MSGALQPLDGLQTIWGVIVTKPSEFKGKAWPSMAKLCMLFLFV